MSAPPGIPPAGIGMNTIEDVIARMREIGLEVKPPDGVAYFNDLYLAVTVAIRDGIVGATAASAPDPRATASPAPVPAAHELGSPPPDAGSSAPPRTRITGPKPAAQAVGFENQEFIDRLDVKFSRYYFDAYASAAADAPSWQPLFHFRARKRSPLQFALCGMNAHINHDLPVAIVATAEEFGVEPKQHSPEHHDFTQVNQVLASVEARVRSEFVQGMVAEVDEALDDEPEKLAMWSIVSARELAWRHAELLWKLRQHRELCEIYHGVLADVAHLAGRGILV
jgi:Family of unknown function (DUF5995)